MEYVATLNAHSSRIDKYGNRYWALEYTDHATGKVVKGIVSGDESNIQCLLFGWLGSEGYNEKVAFNSIEHKIREFNRLTNGWEYAGCTSKELRQFITDKLKD